MLRRVAVLVSLGCVLAAPAAGDDIVGKKKAVDQKIAQLHDKIALAHQREGALTTEISSLTGKIRTLEGQVGDVSLQLGSLERDLALHQAKLARLTQLYTLQTRRLDVLRREYKLAVARLDRRLVDIYESDNTDEISVLLSAGSFSDLVDQVDFINAIGRQDKRIAAAVAVAKDHVTLLRSRTTRLRVGLASETRVIAYRTAQTRGLRIDLLSNQQQLQGLQSQRQSSLRSVKSAEQQFVGEVDSLQQESADLEARIRAAEQSGSSGDGQVTQAPGSLIWPVSGPITSPFGMRWGKLHPGIDIGVPTGTPIHASAPGTVIYAGGMSGYGNLVVIDHGGGIATAYAHQSAIAVHDGEQVAQGQVIGYSGCTGYCTGPHVHFEVRVNGSPVDPLGYLG